MCSIGYTRSVVHQTQRRCDAPDAPLRHTTKHENVKHRFPHSTNIPSQGFSEYLHKAWAKKERKHAEPKTVGRQHGMSLSDRAALRLCGFNIEFESNK